MYIYVYIYELYMYIDFFFWMAQMPRCHRMHRMPFTRSDSATEAC